MALYKCSITLHCITITKNYLVHRINTHRQSDTSHLTISPRSFTYRAITENTTLPQIILWLHEFRQLTVERHLQYHCLKTACCMPAVYGASRLTFTTKAHVVLIL